MPDTSTPDAPPAVPTPTIAQLFSPGYLIQIMGQFGLGGVFAGALLVGMNKWHEEDRADRVQQQSEIRAEMKALTSSIDANAKGMQSLSDEIRRIRKE